MTERFWWMLVCSFLTLTAYPKSWEQSSKYLWSQMAIMVNELFWPCLWWRLFSTAWFMASYVWLSFCACLFSPLYLVIYMHGVPQDCDRTCITVTSLHSPTPFLRLSHKEKNKSCGLNLKLLRRSCLHIVIPTYQSHISEFIWDILFFLCSSIIVIKRNQDTGVDSNPTFGGYTHLTVFLLPILSVLSDTD